MTAKAKTKTQHPTQGAAPVIDRDAEEAVVVQPAGTGTGDGDVGMPTAENAPPCQFAPGNGIVTKDVLEIVLMYLLQLSGNQAEVQPGALRIQMMSAERVAQLSPEAQRWMKPVEPAPAAPAAA